MLNKDIHNGLPEEQLREFLSKQLGKNDCIMSVERAKKRLECAQKEYNLACERQALHTILKMKGWMEIDISDDITDFTPDTYIPFVGTVEEYNNLRELIYE